MSTARQAAKHATGVHINHASDDRNVFDVACSFCKIVKGEAASLKVTETELSYAFIALPQPLVENHTLIVPKYHAAKMHDLPDKYLADIMFVAKKIALAHKLENYNVIQNNGRIAYQTVDHVHFHIVSKPREGAGLNVDWGKQLSQREQKARRAEILEQHSARGKTVCEWTINT